MITDRALRLTHIYMQCAMSCLDFVSLIKFFDNLCFQTCCVLACMNPALRVVTMCLVGWLSGEAAAADP